MQQYKLESVDVHRNIEVIQGTCFCVCAGSQTCMYVCKRTDNLTHTHTHNSRVSDQNGVSLLYIIIEIHHSGRKPSMYTHAQAHVRLHAHAHVHTYRYTHTHSYKDLNMRAHTQTLSDTHRHIGIVKCKI